MTKIELLTKYANDHSYEAWDEFMYDSHGHTQIEATEEVMDMWGKIKWKEAQKDAAEFSNKKKLKYPNNPGFPVSFTPYKK